KNATLRAMSGSACASLKIGTRAERAAAPIRAGLGLACLCLALMLSMQASAQTIYIWEDDDGIQHFSARTPVTEQEVTVQRATAEPQRLIDVVKAGPKDDPFWLFRNRLHGPVTVRVGLVEASNVVSQPPLPADFVLAGLAERELVTI